MAIGVTPQFMPARAPQLEGASFADAVAKVQAIRSQALLDAIRQQMAPIQRAQAEVNLNNSAEDTLANKIALLAAQKPELGIVPVRGGEVPGVGFVSQPSAISPVEQENINAGYAPMKRDNIPLAPGFALSPEIGKQRVADAATLDLGNKIKLIQEEEKARAAAQLLAPTKMTATNLASGVTQPFVLRPGEALPEGFIPSSQISFYSTPGGGAKPKPKGDAEQQKLEATRSHQLTQEEARLREQYNKEPAVANFKTVNGQLEQMKQAIAQGKKDGNFVAADQTLIDNFNRIINPRRAVLASAYNITGRYQPLLDKVEGWVMSGFKGGSGLTDEGRESILEMAKKIREVDSNEFNIQTKRYSSIAKRGGQNPENIIYDPEGEPEAVVGGEEKVTPSGVKYKILTPQ